ncbi:MAG TPA: hypothetical protein DGG95_17315 [Cytophagales bacterium]|jgi:hypothetical protein|nr:hypothetical protein [Cytophagales bacterium]
MGKMIYCHVGLRNKLLLAFLFLYGLSFAQTYTIKQKFTDDYIEVQPFNQGLYCLFRTSEKKAPTTTFMKVFLNEELRATDSVNYSIAGRANLLASYVNGKFLVHAFYSKESNSEKIIFYVCTTEGKILSSFIKTAADFSRYFPKSIKKLKNLELSFVPNAQSPDMLLVQAYLAYGSYPLRSQLVAFNMEDGRELWISNAPFFNLIQTTENLIIGLTSTMTGSAFNSNYLQQIHFVDKSSGKLTKSILLGDGGKNFRNVSVFTTNGIDLMVAGAEYESANSKNGKFYMSMFDLSGQPIFDQVDSAARLSTRRMHLMGSVFNQDGNLVLVGEGFKLDATRMVATTAVSILLGVPQVVGGLDHKIDHLIIATLSSTDGKLTDFKSFPVGPWLSYGRLLTYDSKIILIVSGQVLVYDANETNSAPSLFATLNTGENLILTSFGPIKSKRTNRLITLSRFH